MGVMERINFDCDTLDTRFRPEGNIPFSLHILLTLGLIWERGKCRMFGTLHWRLSFCWGGGSNRFSVTCNCVKEMA